jgi:hypothetical protein
MTTDDRNDANILTGVPVSVSGEFLNPIADRIYERMMRLVEQEYLTGDARQYILMKIILNIYELPEMQNLIGSHKDEL